MTNGRKRLGDFLVEAGLITSGQLQDALAQQSRTRQRLGAILVARGHLTEQVMAETLSRQLGLEIIEPARVAVSPELENLLPRSFVEERHAFPVALGKRELLLAMTDPLDFTTVKDVQFLAGVSVKVAVTTPAAVELFLKGSTMHPDDIREALRKVQSDQVEVVESVEEDQEDLLKLKSEVEAAPVVGMVNMILTEAVKADASDIHIEPRERDVLVRYRIDGLLRDVSTLAPQMLGPVVSRVKIMARMDISVRMRPQDGSTRIRLGDREVDLRISTLPSLHGEKMVIRVLDKSRKLLTLGDLGILPRNLTTIRSFLSRPQGMVLVTGPTGSGKTTTLYAALLTVRSEGVNIITIEDPVEYKIAGITQVPVNEKAGVTFATGLRSILRQDPNVIMVGEIRDRETAEIAFKASLTGHLVLSTLHTNNAVSAITRLVDIGVEPYLVASSVVGVVAQRLVRRSCPHCLCGYVPDPTVYHDLNLDPRRDGIRFSRGQGCERCNFVGYRGRVGVYEILRIDDRIRELILGRASERRILEAAREGGMLTMEEDGLYKAAKRITTPEEILRVIPPEEIVTGDAGSPFPLEATSVETEILGRLFSDTVILVEASDGSLRDLATVLNDRGYDVQRFQRIADALAFLGANASSLAVSDIIVEDGDIGDLEDGMRKSVEARKVPLLAVEGGAKMVGLLQSFGFGPNRVITRPFSLGRIGEKLGLVPAVGA